MTTILLIAALALVAYEVISDAIEDRRHWNDKEETP